MRSRWSMVGRCARVPSRTRQCGLVAATVVLMLLAGCAADTTAEPTAGSGSTAPTTVAAPPTVDPAEAQARRDILAAYNGYLEAYVKATSTADYRTKELGPYVAQPLLGDLLHNLQLMSSSGVHYEGRPVSNPEVTELRLDVGTAVIEGCFDATNWNAVGGKAQPTAQAKRYPVVLKAKRVSGKWYLYEAVADRSATC